MDHAAARSARQCYGILLTQLPVLPAPGLLTEMVAGAWVYPSVRAPRALLGLMNLRGSVIPVFDAEPGAVSPSLRPAQHDVLVFGRDSERAALRLTAPPQQLSLLACEEAQTPPAGTLSPYLGQSFADSKDPSQIWWELDHLQAFRFLASTRAQDAAAGAPLVQD